jgi:predicted XRE-type DNA-binding protein
MKNRLIDGIEVQRGSGNVFADLGLVDAEKLKIKTGLVIEIRKAMRSRGLTAMSTCGATMVGKNANPCCFSSA